MLKLLFLLLLPAISIAQEDDKWDVYLAKYEKGVGSTSVNMSAVSRAPNKNLPFVIITGVTFSACDTHGFPTKEEFENLYIEEELIDSFISKKTKSLLVGTFTYQCQRLNYFYVSDTFQIRELLDSAYKKFFPKYEPYVNIKSDAPWEAYLTFLYPNEFTREYMKNRQVVENLEKEGDKLIKPRQVDHWLYFKTVQDRNCITQFVLQNNFKIENKSYSKESDYPFGLQISRKDKVDLDRITEITLMLRKQALKCHGTYDGWETFVEK